MAFIDMFLWLYLIPAIVSLLFHGLWFWEDRLLRWFELPVILITTFVPVINLSWCVMLILIYALHTCDSIVIKPKEWWEENKFKPILDFRPPQDKG